MACETKKMQLDVKNVNSEASILCISGEVFFGYVQASFFATCNELWATVPKEVRYWLSTGRGTTDSMKERDMVYGCCCKVLAASELLVRWFLSQGCVPNAQLLMDAAAQGQLEVLKRCAPDGDLLSSRVFLQAASGGHLNVMEWLQSKGCKRNNLQCACRAAYMGHIEVLKWLRWEGWSSSDWSASELVSASVEGGKLDTLEFLYAEGFKTTGVRASSIDEAICKGHLGVLEFLHSIGSYFSKSKRAVRACKVAAREDKVEVVKWLLPHAMCSLYEDQSTFKSCLIEDAAFGGHVDVIAFLDASQKLSAADVKNACWHAAQLGHLKVLEFLHSKGYKLDKSMCVFLAKSRGKAEVTEWCKRVLKSWY